LSGQLDTFDFGTYFWVISDESRTFVLLKTTGQRFSAAVSKYLYPILFGRATFVTFSLTSLQGPHVTYNAITVGGGLAGSALAAQLARAGHKILILECETRFKDRVRGENMLP
jgi:NAD(P)-binding Rossmann-like domain